MRQFNFNKIKTVIKRIIPHSLWRYKNKLQILHQQSKTAKICNDLIKKYENGKSLHFPIRPKKDFANEHIIWQYWGQGYENVPEMVRICLDSVEYYKGDFQLLRLTDNNISEYLDIPAEIYQKRKYYLKAHFADFLRLALLATYGGVWLDATILLTGPLPKQYFSYSFFMFQRDNNEENKKYWKNAYIGYWGWDPKYKVRSLNSVIFAHKNNLVIKILCDILYTYWIKKNIFPHYYFFQILFNEFIRSHPALNCPIKSDCLPHYAMTIISEDYPRMSFDDALKLSTMHKMNYKVPEVCIERLKKELNKIKKNDFTR
ncbi:capsular polysaccharide synthesis protein [Bacteroides sp. ET225]|uniref:capsular polysaccharide synthesis protein n=1 Tax=Bacteroides sp. ET225 TaxID=2972461 RepID=UPI0021ACDC6A|nr:capsular polysaccharide synthesis protein [Bacteroides sp. ET225]MCR8916916.1 capsular polysaccharide synthesis protein [Bacteroides sp. ET225]